MAGWLIGKGFNPSATASVSAKVDVNYIPFQWVIGVRILVKSTKDGSETTASLGLSQFGE